MQHSPAIPVLAVALLAALAAGRLPAQAADSVAPDSAPAPAKHGGLFGKAKKFVGNKTVKAVAKTVACTMVPGGQAIAGALNAADSRNAGEAAAGAAGVANGTSCMPGGIGARGMTGGMPQGLTGGTAVGLVGAGANAALVATMDHAGRGAGAMPAMGYGLAPWTLSEDDLARCLGFTPQEYREFTDPTHGAARPATKEEMKRQAKLGQKADMQKYQACMMQQQAAAMQAESAGAPAVDTAAEEPAAVAMSADLVGDLRKGKTTLRQLGWEPGASQLTDGAGGAFSDAMTKLALSLRQAGGTYRADIYLEKQVDKTAADRIGAARLAAVQDALDHAGLPPGLVASGKVKLDKDARLELVRATK